MHRCLGQGQSMQIMSFFVVHAVASFAGYLHNFEYLQGLYGAKRILEAN